MNHSYRAITTLGIINSREGPLLALNPARYPVTALLSQGLTAVSTFAPPLHRPFPSDYWSINNGSASRADRPVAGPDFQPTKPQSVGWISLCSFTKIGTRALQCDSSIQVGVSDSVLSRKFDTGPGPIISWSLCTVR